MVYIYIFFKVAKISKLLLLMKQGKGHQYRGKSLDEIDINLNDVVSDEESENDHEDIKDLVDQNQFTKKGELITSNHSHENTTVKKKIVIIPRTLEEKNTATSFFNKHIILKTAPKKHECENFMQLFPQFKIKTWKKIKDLVYNSSKALKNKK